MVGSVSTWPTTRLMVRYHVASSVLTTRGCKLQVLSSLTPANEVQRWHDGMVRVAPARSVCGSKMGSQNRTLVNGTNDYNLRSPAGLLLTHTHLEVHSRSTWNHEVRL